MAERGPKVCVFYSIAQKNVRISSFASHFIRRKYRRKKKGVRRKIIFPLCIQRLQIDQTPSAINSDVSEKLTQYSRL